MNKECIYVDGKVVVIDENGNKRITENSDKINEILVQENVIETMEKRIKELEKELGETEEDRHYIPDLTIGLILSFVVANTILGRISPVITNTIFGPMNHTFMTSSLIVALILPLASLMDWSYYKQYKNSKKERQGNISEYEYLKKQLVIEKDKLEELKNEQTITSETQEFKVEKVDDLERLKVLRSWFNLYNDLGYNLETFYKYYEQGKLDEKLRKYYTETGIEAAKEYVSEQGPKLVKRK